jgi:hypothetical protein
MLESRLSPVRAAARWLSHAGRIEVKRNGDR